MHRVLVFAACLAAMLAPNLPGYAAEAQMEVRARLVHVRDVFFFEQLDMDRDGLITEEEFHQGAPVNYPGQFFSRIDTDRDLKISWNELAVYTGDGK